MQSHNTTVERRHSFATVRKIVIETASFGFWQESSKDLEVALKNYELHNNCHVWSDPMVPDGDRVYPDKPSVFSSADKKSGVKSYINLFPEKKDVYLAVGNRSNTVQIIHNGFENMFFIHRTTVVRTARGYYNQVFKGKHKARVGKRDSLKRIKSKPAKCWRHVCRSQYCTQCSFRPRCSM